jgi:peptidyl-prolyl cis-trans isomerase B (cyclophilin B)
MDTWSLEKRGYDSRRVVEDGNRFLIANGYMGNDLKHKRGVLSMARTSDPDSASSQFFIMHEDAPHLDAQYAAFGQVVEGMEVVDKIAACKTGRYGFYSDVPRVCIVITDATVVSE